MYTNTYGVTSNIAQNQLAIIKGSDYMLSFPPNLNEIFTKSVKTGQVWVNSNIICIIKISHLASRNS